MPLFSSFTCDTGKSFLLYPLDSETVQHHQHKKCFCQSSVLNTAAGAKWRMLCTRIIRELIYHYRNASPIEIYRRLRSVYCGDVVYVSSDAGSVVLTF
jgi:hypothetical protein